MKYHRLFYATVALCIILWVVVTFMLLSDSHQTKVSFKSQDVLLKRVQDLEESIQVEKNQYVVLLSKLKSLQENSEVSEREFESLRNALKAAELPAKGIKENGSRAESAPGNEQSAPAKTVLPVLVFSCNRVTVTRCIEGLLRHRPNSSSVEFPIVVSQDCGHEATANAIRSYSSRGVTHIMQPDQSDPEVPANEQKFKGYFKISRHYSWALRQMFRVFNHSAVIIVEDDLEVASDFFDYFLATYRLLERDPTLWCVSAWNDNGKANLIDTSHPETLYRSDFFPGLGWMMTKQLWDELEPKWPKSYWDDWMRLPEQRKNRACIRPEVSRTRTFGKIGVSNGMFFEKHLKFIHLNDKPVRFLETPLDYLEQKAYDSQFVWQVYNTPVVSVLQLKTNELDIDGPVRITYHTKDAYKKAAKLLGLMDDFKSGVPRMAYKGIVSFFYNGRRVFLAPTANWKGYDLTWT